MLPVVVVLRSALNSALSDQHLGQLRDGGWREQVMGRRVEEEKREQVGGRESRWVGGRRGRGRGKFEKSWKLEAGWDGWTDCGVGVWWSQAPYTI